MACWRPVSRPVNVAGCSRAPSCPRLPSFPHHPVATLTTGRSELNPAGWTRFDVYPFILLNLAFSLQALYATPLILLAQTRQADRDKAHADADRTQSAPPPSSCPRLPSARRSRS